MTLNKLSLVAFALTVALANFAAADIAQAEDKFAAISYSAANNKIGYCFNAKSKEEAKDLATYHAKAKDGEPVVWVRNGYCALALGDDPNAYGMAWAATPEEAERLALMEARKYTTNCYIRLTVHTEQGLL